MTLTDTVAVTDSTVFKNDTTIYAQWTPKTFVVKFNTGADSQLVKYGGKVTAPAAAPTRANYTFGGWYKDTLYTTAWNFSADTVTSAMTLYAKWTLDKYAVTFDSQGGSAVDTQLIAHGGKVTYPTAPTRTDYTFGGWWKETGYTTAWDFADDIVTSAITLYAKWTLNKYTVTFDSKSGSAVSAQSIEHGGKATLPTAPTRANYTFGGWYKEDTYTTAWDFAADAVTSAVTLYAKWTLNKYAVTFDPQGGGAVSAQSIEHGGKVTEPADPTRDGYNFDGWFKEAACVNAWDFDIGAVTSAVTLYAKWTKLVVHMVTFNTQGGSAVSPHHVEHGGKTTEPADPIIAGFNFDGWYKEAACVNAWDFDVELVTAAVTLYAKWTKIEIHVVTFDPRGGSVLNPQHIEQGGKAVEHATTRDGFTFGGWFREATYINQWIFAADAVTTNVTLYAKWTPITYTITYTLNGGTVSAPANQTSYNIESAFTLKNPTKTGYTFEGWTGTGITSPQKTVSIPQGNQCDRAYTATWSFDPTFVDKRNNQTYKKVLIGTQVWMAENLNYSVEGSRCYDGNFAEGGMTIIECKNNDQGTCDWVTPQLTPDESCEKYGRLYSEDAMINGEPYSTSNPSGVRGACPVGWHVPSYGEWLVLIDYVGGSSTAGKKLKSTSWTEGNYATDEFGFSALPGGECYWDNRCGRAGDIGYWWSSSSGSNTYSGVAVSWYIMNNYDNIQSTTQGNWYSVRCVQD
jgi:uncharacterized protein (TIGR02145 family)/uncharacterized repeat protein (TIGR02543 family)